MCSLPSPGYNLSDSAVDSQRLGHRKGRSGECCRCFGDHSWNVARAVAARREEVWMNHDAYRALFHAFLEGLPEGRRREFHVRRLYDSGPGNLAKHGHDLQEHGVGLGNFRAMIDEDDAGIGR